MGASEQWGQNLAVAVPLAVVVMAEMVPTHSLAVMDRVPSRSLVVAVVTVMVPRSSRNEDNRDGHNSPLRANSSHLLR
jgi:hypothetical protein